MLDWIDDILDDHDDSDTGDHADGSESAELPSLGDHLDIPLDHQADALQNAPAHVQVLYSLDRMTNDIDGFNFDEMKDFVNERSFDAQSYQGLVSNWKGIYGEIRGLEELNASSNDGLHYYIPQSTTHPAIDIYGVDNEGSIQEKIQVKMTDNPDYVKEALEKLPEGAHLMCPSEIANAIDDPRILDAGFTHTELLQDIADTMEVLNTPEAWEKLLSPEFSQWLEKDFAYDPALENV